MHACTVYVASHHRFRRIICSSSLISCQRDLVVSSEGSVYLCLGHNCVYDVVGYCMQKLRVPRVSIQPKAVSKSKPNTDMCYSVSVIPYKLEAIRFSTNRRGSLEATMVRGGGGPDTVLLLGLLDGLDVGPGRTLR